MPHRKTRSGARRSPKLLRGALRVSTDHTAEGGRRRGVAQTDRKGLLRCAFVFPKRRFERQDDGRSESDAYPRFSLHSECCKNPTGHVFFTEDDITRARADLQPCPGLAHIWRLHPWPPWRRWLSALRRRPPPAAACSSPAPAEVYRCTSPEGSDSILARLWPSSYAKSLNP